MNKLQKIEINQYRGLKNMTLDKLSRINVLIGDNNSGKTSVLEAIQLLSNPFSGSLLIDIVFHRLRMIRIGSDKHMGEILKWIFPQVNNEHQPIELSLQKDDKQIPVSFKLMEQEFIDIDLLKKSQGAHYTTTSGLPIRFEQQVSVKISSKEEIVQLGEKIPMDEKTYKCIFKATQIIHGDDF